MRRGGLFLAIAVAAGAMATGTWAATHEGSAGATISPASNSVPADNDVGDDHGGLRPPGVSDDPPGHDANDPDRRGAQPPAAQPSAAANDPDDNDVGDDHGGLRPPGVSDDPPGHDANDPDRGGLNSGPGSGDGVDNSGPGSADDRTDNSGPGSGDGGSGDDHGGHDG